MEVKSANSSRVYLWQTAYGVGFVDWWAECFDHLGSREWIGGAIMLVAFLDP